MFIHSVAAAVVPANIFESGASFATQVLNLILVVAAAVIAWLMLRMLAKAGTFLAAGLAIVLGVVLFWGLTQVNNSSIQTNLTDTVNDTFGLAPGGPSR